MATLASTQTRTGARESILDMIIENDKSAVHLLRDIPKLGNPQQFKHYFPYDKPAEISNKGTVEAAPPLAAQNMSPDYDLLVTTPHHMRVTVGVTKINELLTDRAGVGFNKLLVREVAKATKAMGVAWEKLLLDEGDCQVAAGAGTPWETRGFMKWASNAAQGTLPVPSNYRTPSGGIYDESVDAGQTFAAFGEDNFGDMTEALYNASGDEDDINFIVGSSLKRKISKWSVHDPNVSSTTVVRRMNGTQGTLTTKVSKIETDCGDVTLRMSRYLLRTRGQTDAQHSSAELQRAKRSGFGYVSGSIGMPVAQDLKFKPIGDKEGNSSGKQVEGDCIFFTKGNPGKLAKIRVA